MQWRDRNLWPGEPVVKSTRHEQETCNGGIGTCGLENQWSSQPDMSRLDAMEGSEPVVKSTRHEQETCNGGIGTCGQVNQT